MRRTATHPVFFATILIAVAGLLLLVFQVAGPAPAPARAAGAVHRASTITPVVGCAQLQLMDFSQIPGAPTQVTSAATVTINGAAYCEVKGEQPLSSNSTCGCRSAPGPAATCRRAAAGTAAPSCRGRRSFRPAARR